MISSPAECECHFCIELAIRRGHFDAMMAPQGTSAMLKPLIESASKKESWCNIKWKLRITIVTPVGFGESRISAGAEEPDSRRESARDSEIA
jgi:hypothetical protein